MKSAVLFLVFNRPDTTARVFEAIRRARPPRLYVAADGPRASRPGEAELCDQARRIATTVDWPCQLKTLLRVENLGCGRAVSAAIDWFFEQEPEGIVLEDDCLPVPTFFSYCEEMLERYRTDERVMSVSGDNFISEVWRPQSSYYFSGYAHIWGWASWARAWTHYRFNINQAGEESVDTVLNRAFPNRFLARRYWRSILEKVASGSIDTWDYQWNYAMWRRGGLSCTPALNLISNIGFGASATHTHDTGDRFSNLASKDIEFPLRHPHAVVSAHEADRWSERNILGLSLSEMARQSAADVLHWTRGLTRARKNRVQ